MREPTIGVYATGGTIASAAEDGNPIEPSLTADGLIGALPGLAGNTTLRVVDFRRVPSVELTAADVVALLWRLKADASDGVDGFVITQGTDTLEECAFGLDQLWEGEQPIVVTGAMRGPSALGADGPANLLSAIAVASSPAARGAGCVVVLNDEIHAARHVCKTHTTSLAAFASPTVGAIGAVTENRVRLWSRSLSPPKLSLPAASSAQVPVALVRVAFGDDARILSELVPNGYRGAVVEAMGAGHVPEAFVEPLRKLAAAMPVVLVSRTGPHELLRETYGFPGSETDLLSNGLLTAGILDGLKARVKLTLLLMANATPAQIASAFDAESHGLL